MNNVYSSYNLGVRVRVPRGDRHSLITVIDLRSPLRYRVTRTVAAKIIRRIRANRLRVR